LSQLPLGVALQQNLQVASGAGKLPILGFLSKQTMTDLKEGCSILSNRQRCCLSLSGQFTSRTILFL